MRLEVESEGGKFVLSMEHEQAHRDARGAVVRLRHRATIRFPWRRFPIFRSTIFYWRREDEEQLDLEDVELITSVAIVPPGPRAGAGHVRR